MGKGRKLFADLLGPEPGSAPAPAAPTGKGRAIFADLLPKGMPAGAAETMGLGSAFVDPGLPEAMQLPAAPTVIEGQDIVQDGRRGFMPMPDSYNAAVARGEAVDREIAYQEGQQARAQADAALNPATWVDDARTFAAAEAEGLGAMAYGVGGAWQGAHNRLFANPLRALGGPDVTTDNPMAGLAGLFDTMGGDLRESNSAGYKQLRADNEISGNIFDPGSIEFGENPTARGMIANGVDVLGSLAPIIAGTYLSGGSTATGLTIGGAQGGGAAMKEAEGTIERMWLDGTLAAESKRYRDLVAQGASEQEAYEQTRRDAGEWAGGLTAPVSALGGALTSKILAPGTAVLGRLPAAVRIPGVAGLSGLEEASQEVEEGRATRIGTNIGAGTELDPNEDSAANAILGAMGGAGPGAVAGIKRTPPTAAEQLADALKRAIEDEAHGRRTAQLMERRETPTGLVMDEAPSSAPLPAGATTDPRGPVVRQFEAEQTAQAPTLNTQQPDVSVSVGGQAVQGNPFRATPRPEAREEGIGRAQVDAQAERAAREADIAEGVEAVYDTPDGPMPLPAEDLAPADNGEWKREWKPVGESVSKKSGKRVVQYGPKLDLSRDNLLHWLAANGGVDFEQVRAQGGADPAAMKDPDVMRPFGKAGVAALRKTGGMSLDTVLELMQQDGWLPENDPNAPPTVENNDALDLIMEAINGRDVFHPWEGADERAFRAAEDAQWQELHTERMNREWAELERATTAEALRRLREATQADIAEADGAEAADLYELTRRARAAGATADQAVQADGEEAGAYAARLWGMAEGGRGNGSTDTGTAETDSGRGESGPRRGQAADSPVDSPRAGTPSTGLFGQPTAREQAEGRAREVANKRDGKTGGVTPSFSGTPLGATGSGAAPAQATVPEAKPPSAAEPEAGEKQPKERKAHPKSTAPEHAIPEDAGDILEMSVEQIEEVARNWREHIDNGGHDGITNIFAQPSESERVRLLDKAGVRSEREDGKTVYHRDAGWMTPEEAKAKVEEWKANAKAQGEGAGPDGHPPNYQRVVLSLFDKTGAWAQPWAEAGYTVYTFDIQDDPDFGDVTKFDAEFFMENFGMFEDAEVYAVLAACPCTDFANSGNRHKAEKDKDGRTALSVNLVNHTLATIEYLQAPVWAIENPVGRIEKLGGLPRWRASFDPFVFGEPYTKRTLLWGRFNGDMPVAPVEPVDGSKMHSKFGGKSQKTKDARSETPEGFAYAFFDANNAIDNPLLAVTGKYDQLDPTKIEAALDAGANPLQIDDAVQEFYYGELDYDAANRALDYIAENGFPEGEDYSFWQQFGSEPDARQAEADDEDGEADALRRPQKRKFRKAQGAITDTRDDAQLAYENELFTENGYTDDEVANMPPSQQLTVARRIIKSFFGFETVEATNNLNTLEALNQLKFAYRNMQSMGAALAWPGSAFGKIAPNLVLARDGGGALAMYSPGTSTITMTRQNDAFAHEFGHGIDWWVWKELGMSDPETGAPRGRGATGKLRLGAELNDKPIEAAFVALNEAMYSEHGDAAVKIASIEKHILVINKQIADLRARADATLDADRKAKMEESIEKKQAHIVRLSKQIEAIAKNPAPEYKADSNYYLNSRMLDKKGATENASDGGYWQRPTEMFARAFEAWVSDRVESAGGSTEWLGRTNARYLDSSSDFIQKAYPQALDRERIFAAIDDLVLAVRDSVTEGLGGNVLTTQPANMMAPKNWRAWTGPVAGAEQLHLVEAIRESMDNARSQEVDRKAAGKKLNDARLKVRDELRVSGSKAETVMLQIDETQIALRRAWAGSIGGYLKAMERRYPKSAALARVSRLFTTTPGKGQVRGQVYEEFLQHERARWGNQLARIVDKHHLNSQKHWTPQEHRMLRDALVDSRKGDDRPPYIAKVVRAAEDMRTFHDELFMYLQNNGIDLGYAKNGYLQRIMAPENVAADPTGFIEAASGVYLEVFEKEVGTLDSAPLDQLVRYAQELPGLNDDPRVKALLVEVRAVQKAAARNDEEAVAAHEEAIRQILDGDGLYEAIRADWALEASRDWQGRILGTTPSDDFSVQTSKGRFMKSRVLPESADIALGDYMVVDSRSLAATYMASAINRVAFEKFFPDDNKDKSPATRIGEIESQLRRDGVLSEDVEETIASVRLMVGLYRPNMTTAGMRFQSSIVATWAPVLLGRALYSQFAEPLVAASRTGNVLDAAAIYKAQLADLGLWLPGVAKVVKALFPSSQGKALWRREFGEFLGAVTNAHFDHVMNNRENTLYANKAAGQKLSNFYLYSGIHGHTMSMRRAAAERSTYYFKRIAKKALKGDKLAIRDLADLGIDATADRGMVEYLANKMSLRPSIEEVRANPDAEKLAVAINRFIDEIVMNPKIVEKPRRASTVETSLIYGVLSYTSAFTQNVIFRTINRVKTAAEKDGATAGAVAAASAAAMIGVQMAGQTAQYLMRVTLFGDLGDELEKAQEEPGDFAMTIASRSGWTGLADPLVNALTSVRYRRSFSELLAGPYLGFPLQAANKFAFNELNESKTTNTSAYNRIVAAWDLLVAPTVATVVLRKTPWMAPILAMSSSSKAKNAVAEAAVGPKGERKDAVSGKGTDTRRQTRHNRANSRKRQDNGRGSGR